MKSRPLIIIPAFNEEQTIAEVVRRAQPYGDVCIVNDASTDRTAEIIESLEGVHCIHHEKNTHIPGAVMDGMRYAVEQEYPCAIAMDAGLSHDPTEIPGFLALQDQADVVIGRRDRKTDTPWFRSLLSWAGNILYNYALDPSRIIWKKASFGDVTSGYRLYSRRTMQLLLSRKLESRSFDFIIEALMYAYRNQHVITETPIHYHFTGSSLNWKVIRDANRMLFLMIFVLKK